VKSPATLLLDGLHGLEETGLAGNTLVESDGLGREVGLAAHDVEAVSLGDLNVEAVAEQRAGVVLGVGEDLELLADAVKVLDKDSVVEALDALDAKPAADLRVHAIDRVLAARLDGLAGSVGEDVEGRLGAVAALGEEVLDEVGLGADEVPVTRELGKGEGGLGGGNVAAILLGDCREWVLRETG
jgi:hypothetical protein